ncbi:MAG: hypothetical protein IT381_28770 [Deltaproteobacteria bacterium]|nr:hypothetical protein [Deltaproteobacteria bacterium]
MLFPLTRYEHSKDKKLLRVGLLNLLLSEVLIALPTLRRLLLVLSEAALFVARALTGRVAVADLLDQYAAESRRLLAARSQPATGHAIAREVERMLDAPSRDDNAKQHRDHTLH